jgi:AmiR/NasT family two-component response regulator
MGNALVKTNVDGYLVNPMTKTIINNNDKEYDNIIVLRKKNKEMHDLRSQVNKLDDELKNIKELLRIAIKND